MNAQLDRRTGNDRRLAGTHGAERRFTDDRRSGSVIKKAGLVRHAAEPSDDYWERLFRLPI